MSVEITSSTLPMLVADEEAASAGGGVPASVDLFAPNGPVLSLVCEGFLPDPCRVDVPFGEAPGETAGGTAGRTADGTVDGASGATRSALDGLLRVAGAEPVCQALEHWLRTAFDLVPIDESQAVPDAAAPLRLRAAHRSSACPPLTLHLPAHALGLLPAVPANVAASIDLRFAPVPAICRLARVDLDEGELSRLDIGGALLLPETFGGGWPVKLEAHGFAAAARLEPGLSRIVLVRGRLDTVELALDPGRIEPLPVEAPPTPSGTGGAAPRRLDIVLDGTVAFDPGGVLGGAGPIRVELPGALADCRVHCLVDGLRRFGGHVAPLGDGYAFFARERGAGSPVVAAPDRTEG